MRATFSSRVFGGPADVEQDESCPHPFLHQSKHAASELCYRD